MGCSDAWDNEQEERSKRIQKMREENIQKVLKQVREWLEKDKDYGAKLTLVFDYTDNALTSHDEITLEETVPGKHFWLRQF